MRKWFLKRHPSAPKPQFGVPLLELLKQEQQNGMSSSSSVVITAEVTQPRVPLILRRLGEWVCDETIVTTEGLFRHSPSFRAVNELKDQLQQDIHAVAGTLKWWLRDLPGNVVSKDITDELIQARIDFNNLTDTSETLLPILRRLPVESYWTLRYILAMCVRISQFQEGNMMSMQNLSLVFAPNIFNSGGDSEVQSMSSLATRSSRDVEMMSKSTKLAQVLVFLMQHFEDVMTKVFDVETSQADFLHWTNDERRLLFPNAEVHDGPVNHQVVLDELRTTMSLSRSNTNVIGSEEIPISPSAMLATLQRRSSEPSIKMVNSLVSVNSIAQDGKAPPPLPTASKPAHIRPNSLLISHQRRASESDVIRKPTSAFIKSALRKIDLQTPKVPSQTSVTTEIKHVRFNNTVEKLVIPRDEDEDGDTDGENESVDSEKSNSPQEPADDMVVHEEMEDEQVIIDPETHLGQRYTMDTLTRRLSDKIRDIDDEEDEEDEKDETINATMKQDLIELVTPKKPSRPRIQDVDFGSGTKSHIMDSDAPMTPLSPAPKLDDKSGPDEPDIISRVDSLPPLSFDESVPANSLPSDVIVQLKEKVRQTHPILKSYQAYLKSIKEAINASDADDEDSDMKRAYLQFETGRFKKLAAEFQGLKKYVRGTTSQGTPLVSPLSPLVTSPTRKSVAVESRQVANARKEKHEVKKKILELKELLNDAGLDGQSRNALKQILVSYHSRYLELKNGDQVEAEPIQAQQIHPPRPPGKSPILGLPAIKSSRSLGRLSPL